MSTMKNMSLVAVLLLGMAGVAGNVLAEGEQTPRVPEPTVPAQIAAQGVVYHTLTGREAQVTFTSKAPLENIVGKSNEVAGYAVAGLGDSPASLVGAEWILPVESLATGLPMRDKHIAKSEWLNAKSFPEIRFVLTSTQDVALVKSGDGFSTWSLTLVGDMTLHGETHSIRVQNAKLSFLAASERTAKIAAGDLCFLKCTYQIKMSDFGIHHKDVPNKVSDEIKLSQMLRMSTTRE